MDDSQCYSKQVTTDFASSLRSSINKELKYIHSRYSPKYDRDRTVYTGSAGSDSLTDAVIFPLCKCECIYLGLALLYLRLSSVDEQYGGYLQDAADLADEGPKSRLSFLCGKAGPLALSAVLHNKLENQDRSRRQVDKLLALVKDVAEPGMASEHLYGHAGYLFALLFAQRHLGKDNIPDSAVQKVG